MTRYAVGQFVFAFVVTAIGAIKGARLLLDQIDDALGNLAGLS